MSKHGQKNLTRAKRLKSAKRWLASYRGKNLVRAYKKWFGVSDVCAVQELRMLGANIPEARLEQARRDEQARARASARRKEERALQNRFSESDETFAFIAGYTEGGAPYGVTWEEMGAEDRSGASSARAGRHTSAYYGAARRTVATADDDESLPF